MNAPDGWSTRLISDVEQLAAIAEEWRLLFERCPHATPFERPEWLLSWAQAFRPEVLHTIEVRRHGALVGLAPLFLYRAGADRILVPLGASISDYIDWLIDPIQSAAILERIFAVLRDSRKGWDRLELSDVPPSSPLLTFRSSDWDVAQSPETACPILELPRGAKSVAQILSGKARHNLRTAAHRMERMGRAKFEIATRETVDEFLAAMMRLHGARWNEFGTRGVLSEKRVQEFHRIAARALLGRGVLRLYGLRLQGQLIAALYALVGSETFYCYLQGFDPAYGPLSPGAQILGRVIDDALREGKTRVDFLRGRERYKYAWGGRDSETWRLSFQLRSPVQERFRPHLAA